MRRGTLLLLLALLSPVACDDAEPSSENSTRAASESRREEPAVREWDAPPDYSYQVTSRCGEQSLIGKLHIVVANGKVATARGLDEAGEVSVRSLKNEIPTLTVLHGYAATAERDGAEIVDVDYAPKDGHPERIEIDYDTDAIDDESCYVITEYQEAST